MKLWYPIILTLAAALGAAPGEAQEPDSPGPSAGVMAGVATGALLGGLVGGPPGAIVGLAIGGFTAEQSRQARQVPRLSERMAGLETERQRLAQENAGLARRLEAVETSLDRYRREQAKATDVATAADGLAFAIRFRTASSEPPPEAGRSLEALATLMQAAPELVVHLDGYADPRGDAGSNRLLSADRAAAIRDALVARGVAAPRIRWTGHGELGSGRNDPDAWAQSRRVDLRLRLADDKLAAAP